jgi:hypothetical protein
MNLNTTIVDSILNKLGFISFSAKTSKIKHRRGTTAVDKFLEKEFIPALIAIKDEGANEMKLQSLNNKDQLINDVIDYLYNRVEKEKTGKDDSIFLSDKFEVIRNMQELEEYFLYDKKSQTVSIINAKAFLDVKEEIVGEAIAYTPAIVEYNPHSFERRYDVVDDVGDKIPYFNCYNPPKWRLREPTDNPTPPQEFIDYIEILFPKEEDRYAALGWLRTALLTRAETFLVMNGPKGVGKGILGDEIVARLVGIDNWKKAGSGFLVKEFNSALQRGKIIHIDEFGNSSRQVNAKLKNYINRRVNIEKKGVDDFTTEHYTSFIISSNELADIQIFSDDRRFSVVDVNPTPGILKQEWGTKKINEFIEMINKDEEAIYQIGNWILKEGDKEPYNDLNYAHKGPHFWRLVKSTLLVWQRNLIEALYAHQKEVDKLGLSSAGLFDWAEVKKSFNRSRTAPTEWLKIEEFLKSHFDEEGNSPARMVKVAGEKVLIPNKAYMDLWEGLDRGTESYDSLDDLDSMEDVF